MTTRIYLNHGYRGKDVGEKFFPAGEHDFPSEIADRLIESGQALRVGRGKLQDFVGAPQNVAVTVEQVLAAVADMDDARVIELAALNGIVIPDATTRARALAALVEAALRPNAVLNLTDVTSKAVPVQPRLATDERERLEMLHEAGKLEHHPDLPTDDPLPSLDDNASDARKRVELALLGGRSLPGDVDFTAREFTKDILAGYAKRLGVTHEKDATKAEIIAALKGEGKK